VQVFRWVFGGNYLGMLHLHKVSEEEYFEVIMGNRKVSYIEILLREMC
jgi:hypothetical protein